MALILSFILSIAAIKKLFLLRKCFINSPNDKVSILPVTHSSIISKRAINCNKKTQNKNLIQKLVFLFDSVLSTTKANSKILVLLSSSLISTFTLLIMLPFLKEYFDVSLSQKVVHSSLEIHMHAAHSNMCKWKKNFLVENYLLMIVSLPLSIFLYVWNWISSSRKQKRLNFDFVVPMNPFSKSNRFITCIIYAAYIHSISKIFEFSITSASTFNAHFNAVNLTQTTTKLPSTLASLTTSSVATAQPLLNDNLIQKLHSFQSLSAHGILIDLLLRVLNVTKIFVLLNLKTQFNLLGNYR